MNVRCLDLPDEPAEWAGWLEGELAGWRLAELTAELSAVLPSTEPVPAFADVIGPHAPAVLASGLAGLPLPALRTLLAHPGLLLELQRWLLEEGAPYWLERFQASQGGTQTLQQTRERLRFWLAAERPAERRTPQRIAGRHVRIWLAPAAAAMLIAAAAGYLYWTQMQQPTAWGWNRSDVFAANVAAGPYLDRLADAAQRWFDERPENAPALAERLSAMRLGCTRLLLAEHTPLAAADRAWLKEALPGVAQKFDKALADLEEGADPLAVRGEADATVRKLIEALHTRARQAEQVARFLPEPGA